MSTDQSTPATDRVERFARNFRNVGNVEEYDIDRYENLDFTNLMVYLNGAGMNFDPIRERGWNFDVFDVYQSANRTVVHVRLYDEDVEGWLDVLDDEIIDADEQLEAEQ